MQRDGLDVFVKHRIQTMPGLRRLATTWFLSQLSNIPESSVGFLTFFSGAF